LNKSRSDIEEEKQDLNKSYDNILEIYNDYEESCDYIEYKV
jgi:hypothetical protein